MVEYKNILNFNEKFPVEKPVLPLGKTKQEIYENFDKLIKEIHKE